MTISALFCRMPDYDGNGATTEFAYTFKTFATAHLVVTLYNDAGQGTVLTEGVHYTAEGIAPVVGGTVTMVTAPETGETLRIERIVPIRQLTDLKNAGEYYPETIEDAYDYACMISQQLDQLFDDLNDAVTIIEGEGIDLFAQHIVEGFDAVFRRIDARNSSSTSSWRGEVDVDGHYSIANLSGLAGRLKLAIAGYVDLGDVTYRQTINAQTGTTYTVLASDKSKRITCSNNDPITVTIPQSLGLAAGDFFDIQHKGVGAVSLVTSGAASLTANGGTANTVRRGDTIRVRCTATDTYQLEGEYDRNRVTEKVVTLTSASGVVTIDWSLGNLFKLTLTENVTSIVHSNLPSGRGQSILLQIVQHASAAKTVAGWAAGTKFFDGTYVASSTVSAIDELGLTNYGDGTTVICKYARSAA